MGAGNDGSRLYAPVAVGLVALVCLAVSYEHQQDLYDNLRVGARDLSFFTQSLWNLVAGNGLRTTIGFRGPHLFAEHFYLTHALWAPLYALIPSASVLFFGQALGIALSGVAIFLVGRTHGIEPGLAALAAIAFMLQPTLHGAAAGINFYGYHPDTLFPPLFLFAYLALRKERLAAFWLLCLACLATLEQSAFVLAPFGLFIYMDGRKKLGLAVAVVSTAWFVAATRYAVPTFGDGRTPYYFKAAKFFDSSLVVYMAREWIEYVVQFGILLAGLPLLSGFSLVAVPISVVYMQALSVGYTVPLAILSWHTDLVLPVLGVAAVRGLSWLVRRFDRLRASIYAVCVAWCAALGAVTYAYVYAKPAPVIPADKRAALGALKQMIPATADLSASYFTAAHFSNRKNLWIFPKIAEAEYVLVNAEKDFDYHKDEDSTYRELRAGTEFTVIFEEAGFTLFKR